MPHCLPCEHTLHNKFYQVYFALVLYFVPPLPLPPISIKLDYWLGCTPATSLACCRLGGALPHLSFHLHPGGDAPHSLAHPYFAGCVAATLVTLLIIARVCCCHPCCLNYLLLLGCVAATLVALLIITRVCRCHPYCLHLQGVLLPPSIYAREHPMSLVPFTAKDCVVCSYNYYV